MATKEEIVKSVPQTGFFGHPKGLFSLFFTEFWERFSYYGMKAILIYFMYDTVQNGGLGLDKATAASIMAIYGSLVYMSGIIGGWIADRILGTRRTIFWGGILIILGHLSLAIPGGLTFLFASMILIILGTGLLKPNVSSVVGDMYAEDDTRRDAGFNIFYMGINAGAFISPLIVGAVQKEYNYHVGFSIAAIGMAIGLFMYTHKQKQKLGLAGLEPKNPLNIQERNSILKKFIAAVIIVAVLVVIAAMSGMLSIGSVVNFFTVIGLLAPIAVFIWMFTSKKTKKEEKSHLLAYIPLFITSTMFWVIQEQGSTILAAYIDTRTDLTMGSFKIPAAWFQSLNPLFIITMAPIFAWIWVRMGKRQPSTPIKFAFSLLFAGVSFLIMIIPAITSGGKELISPWWIVLSFFLVVVGELLMSPVGLSATTKLAPAAFAAQTMSLWFLTSTAAQALNAQFAKLFAKITEVQYFGYLGGASVLLFLVMLILSPWISKKMGNIR
ncbi:peptide MFS transporter [Rummeliibacillus sp. TYF005]|uniref:peptide MFS transporter n=1 Tax=Rummeliibacillus sp. TYF005 TaxID=2058214 RepID=UPI000F526201|nr:peptide MFS transporter [Rummeliibacillus sp. TYF005]RPJ95081.1 peptide MFS transporter [Rummeliibacillus sp. TYF005]